MRFLKGLVLSVFVAAIVVVGAGFLLPARVTVERSVVINAPPDRVFTYVSDLRNFKDWSPWARIDPATSYTFEGPEVGPGQRMKWVSTNERVGSGSQEIVDLTPGQQVRLALDFGSMGTARAWYDIAPDGSGTLLTWGFVTELGRNPLMRWMGLMFDRWIGSDFETGLQSLKTNLESQAS